MLSTFDFDWVKENTSQNNRIKYSFETSRNPYSLEYETQTVWWDGKQLAAVDEWGGDLYLDSWQEFEDLLSEHDVVRLMEIQMVTIEDSSSEEDSSTEYP